MSEIGKPVDGLGVALLQNWAGAHLIIWLSGFVVLTLLIVALVLICVGRIRFGWKSKKREFQFETSNGRPEICQPATLANQVPKIGRESRKLSTMSHDSSP